jgi:hypothetical protein
MQTLDLEKLEQTKTQIKNSHTYLRIDYDVRLFMRDRKPELNINNIWFIVRATLDRKLDVLEYIFFSHFLEKKMILSVVEFITRMHLIIEVLDYLETVTKLEYYDYMKRAMSNKTSAENDTLVERFLQEIDDVDHRTLSEFIAYGSINLFDKAWNMCKIKKKFVPYLTDAISSKNLSMVKYAIGLGANINVKGHSLMRDCAQTGTPEIAMFFMEKYGFEFHPNKELTIMHAVSNNNLDFVKYLSSIGWDVAIQRNNRPLESAACGGRIEMCQYLISKGAQMKSDAKYVLRSTIWRRCDTKIITMLLELNPTIDQLMAAFKQVRHADGETFALIYGALVARVDGNRKLGEKLKCEIMSLTTGYNFPELVKAINKK